jgi:DNA helicase-2/ATP-dependent DNA helicase PcrA
MEEGIFPHARATAVSAEGGTWDPEEMAEERRLCYVGITRAEKQLFLTHAYRRTVYGMAQEMKPSRFLSDLPDELVDRQMDLSNLIRSSVLGDDEGLGEVQVGGRTLDMTELLSRAQQNSRKARERAKSEPEAPPAAPAPTARKEPPTREERRKRAEAKARKSARTREAARAEAAAQAPAPAPRPSASGLDWRPGDRVSHAKFGQGTVIQVQGEGADAELTVAFADQGVKRLLADVAPIEKV